MNKKIIWSAVSCLMVFSLILASCSTETESPTTPTTSTTPAESTVPTTTEEEKPEEIATSDTPQYGGTITITANEPTNWDPIRFSPSGGITNTIYQKLWEGDWARGPAGGYGTYETDWGAANNDIFDLKAGFIAESWDWSLDSENGWGTIVYQIRRGVHWAINLDSKASKMVNGREVTTDDVIYCLKRAITEDFAYIYGVNSELREADIQKTGTWEITIKLPISAMYSGVTRFGGGILLYPPELISEYDDMLDWKVSVGTGPFMLDDYVAGSAVNLIRNPNYWMKDPVGPGKGNQFPYLDGVRMLIIPDKSTQLAALRTGQIDQMKGLAVQDAEHIRKTAPALVEKVSTGDGRCYSLAMRIDTDPFDDIQVRRAMNMAIDFAAINTGLYGGAAAMPVYPYGSVSPYGAIALNYDDPDFPESAKELYSYNPEKAKQLLADAGYPDGFQTSLLISSTDIDYCSIIKDYLAAVNIDMQLDVREKTVVSSITRKREHEAMAAQSAGPVADFINGLPILSGGNRYNLSMIDDPYINRTMDQIRLIAITDQHEALSLYREMTKYIVDQAYVIPKVVAPTYYYWWPWVKNYSGELAVGADDFGWYQYVWYDESLKKSMGY